MEYLAIDNAFQFWDQKPDMAKLSFWHDMTYSGAAELLGYRTIWLSGYKAIRLLDYRFVRLHTFPVWKSYMLGKNNKNNTTRKQTGNNTDQLITKLTQAGNSGEGAHSFDSFTFNKSSVKFSISSTMFETLIFCIFGITNVGFCFV